MKIQKINFELFNNNYFESSDEKIYNFILILIINFPIQQNENLLNIISKYIENLQKNEDNFYIKDKFLLILLQLLNFLNEKYKNDVFYYHIKNFLTFHIHKFLKIVYNNNFLLVEQKRNLLLKENNISQEFLETNFSNFNVKEKFIHKDYNYVLNKRFVLFDKDIKIVKNIFKNEDNLISYLKKKFNLYLKKFLSFLFIKLVLKCFIFELIFFKFKFEFGEYLLLELLSFSDLSLFIFIFFI